MIDKIRPLHFAFNFLTGAAGENFKLGVALTDDGILADRGQGRACGFKERSIKYFTALEGFLCAPCAGYVENCPPDANGNIFLENALREYFDGEC